MRPPRGRPRAVFSRGSSAQRWARFLRGRLGKGRYSRDTAQRWRRGARDERFPLGACGLDEELMSVRRDASEVARIASLVAAFPVSRVDSGLVAMLSTPCAASVLLTR